MADVVQSSLPVDHAPTSQPAINTAQTHDECYISSLWTDKFIEQGQFDKEPFVWRRKSRIQSKMATKSVIMKQYMSLVKNISSFSNGQALLSETNSDEDQLDKVNITISPSEGYYRGGTFEFQIDLSDGYPDADPPRIRCLTSVYHPNIDQNDDYSEGDICLNMLDELWSPDLTLEDYIQGLLFLFYEPNPEDPLNPAFCGDEDEEKWSYNIRRSLRGYEIDGTTYDTVLSNGYTSDDDETYDDEYDTYIRRKNGDAPPVIDDDSCMSLCGSLEDLAVQNDDVIVATVTKPDDVITLPTIDEATGQPEAVNVNLKPVSNLVSIITRILRIIRPQSPVSTDSYNTALISSAPLWRFLLISSIAMVTFRIGLRVFLRTPSILFR